MAFVSASTDLAQTWPFDERPAPDLCRALANVVPLHLAANRSLREGLAESILAEYLVDPDVALCAVRPLSAPTRRRLVETGSTDAAVVAIYRQALDPDEVRHLLARHGRAVTPAIVECAKELGLGDDLVDAALAAAGPLDRARALLYPQGFPFPGGLTKRERRWWRTVEPAVANDPTVEWMVQLAIDSSKDLFRLAVASSHRAVRVLAARSHYVSRDPQAQRELARIPSDPRDPPSAMRWRERHGPVAAALLANPAVGAEIRVQLRRWVTPSPDPASPGAGASWVVPNYRHGPRFPRVEGAALDVPRCSGDHGPRWCAKRGCARALAGLATYPIQPSTIRYQADDVRLVRDTPLDGPTAPVGEWLAAHLPEAFVPPSSLVALLEAWNGDLESFADTIPSLAG